MNYLRHLQTLKSERLNKSQASSIGKPITLNCLQVGEKGRIIALLGEVKEVQRLMAMGFLEDTIVENLYESPASNPTAYFVRGVVLALRQADCKKIVVTKLK